MKIVGNEIAVMMLTIILGYFAYLFDIYEMVIIGMLARIWIYTRKDDE